MERAVARGQRAKGPRVPRRLGVDEKAAAKGHRYLTLVCDLTRATVEYIADDRKQASLDAYFATVPPDQLARIEAIAMDMWEPYVQSVLAHVPNGQMKIVFDKYHIMSHMGTAVDTVRKREHRVLRDEGNDVLTGSKYVWLYAGPNVPEKHQPRLLGAARAPPEDRPGVGDQGNPPRLLAVPARRLGARLLETLCVLVSRCHA